MNRIHHIELKYVNDYCTYHNNFISQRKVIRLEDRYRKIWYGDNPQKKLGTKNLNEHIRLVNEYNPGYILDYDLNEKEMVIDYKILPGIELVKINYNNDFKKKVYDYCLSHILSTWPYAYFDWKPMNILIDGDSMHLIDWDCIRYASKDYSLKNMIKLLENKFERDF